jgi:hypothetical protein
MSQEHSKDPTTTARPDKLTLGEPVDELAGTVTIDRGALDASLRVPDPDEPGEVDELARTLEVDANAARAAAVRDAADPAPHLGEEVDELASTVTLDAAALASQIAEDHEP